VDCSRVYTLLLLPPYIMSVTTLKGRARIHSLTVATIHHVTGRPRTYLPIRSGSNHELCHIPAE
jgi:hypothetical protein